MCLAHSRVHTLAALGAARAANRLSGGVQASQSQPIRPLQASLPTDVTATGAVNTAGSVRSHLVLFYRAVKNFKRIIKV